MVGLGAGDATGCGSVSEQGEGEEAVLVRSMGETLRVSNSGDSATGADQEEATFGVHDQQAGKAGRGLGRRNGARSETGRKSPRAKAGNARSLAAEVHEHQPQLETQGVRQVNTANLMDLLKAQHMKCALSGRELTPRNVTIDHINPFSESDDHTIDNVHLVVDEINRAKGTMSTGDFIRMCQDVAAMHPRVSQ